MTLLAVVTFIDRVICIRFARMTGQPAEEPLPDDPQSSFHHSRMLFSQLGLTSWDKRSQVHLLKKCDKLLRELKNLDNQVTLCLLWIALFICAISNKDDIYHFCTEMS